MADDHFVFHVEKPHICFFVLHGKENNPRSQVKGL